MSLVSRLRFRPDAAVDRSIDEAAVRAALAGVDDPELHLPLPEAGMLGDLEIRRDGTVRVTVRLTTAACPLKETLGTDVTDAVSQVAGVGRVGGRVHVDVRR